MQKVFRVWFLSFILLTLVAGFVYISVQQAYRHAADDPQIQLSHDLALSLNSGTKFVSAKKIDVSREYAPFTIVYDKNGQVVVSEAVLHGQTPNLPDGVLNYTATNGEDRLTWQPESGVRLATVVSKFNNGYVLVGRSLYETEVRESELEQGVAIFWILGNIIMLAAITAVAGMKGKK